MKTRKLACLNKKRDSFVCTEIFSFFICDHSSGQVLSKKKSGFLKGTFINQKLALDMTDKKKLKSIEVIVNDDVLHQKR